MAARPPLSLRARALQWLAQREQSRVELRRKLLRVVTAEAAREDHARRDDGSAAEIDDRSTAEGVDGLLDRLEADGLLSSERFIESRIHSRQRRFGNLRIRIELAQHGVAIDADTALALAASELARAAAVRERRFGPDPAADSRQRAAQSRFLARRGFSAEVVRRVMRDRS